ncbi:hypothetical protein PFICI_05936 [Pestalotiopsis fici W106-1]|uniref:FAD-binding FR-type domain-containing protein n=1 Tax=Pestalotiopsis fici (strain W106-1 / CGMCC3.15140) TaxID=1229662 RepID=W3XDD0_PESFW|nr:uncharacterized protein PFICI_05936 [Pestalotiopsis fici W106-1]ETS84060.1 hypothetical protein PFICI_05936 [Pestalotiopsis fici W106-1]
MPSTLGFRLTFEVPHWYAIVSGTIIILLLFSRSRRRLSLRFAPWINRHVFMPLSLWHLTRLQVAQASAYLVLNVLTLSVFIRSAAEVGQRAAVLCTFNMIPLFTTGRVLATILNISIWTYDLWHNAIGLVVVVQGLIHGGISISTRSVQLRSYTVTGWVVSLTILLLLFTSVPIVRRRLKGLFGLLHGMLATASLATLAIHVLPLGLGTSTVQIFVAGALLLVGMCWRLLLLLRRGRATKIETIGASQDMSCVKVTLRDAIRPYPGMYFHLYLSGTPLRNRLAGTPTPAFFWSEGTAAKDIHFLVRDPSTKPLSMRLEGPYGNNLHLEEYDSVLLFAESTGVSSIMPYALHLLHRRRHDQREKERLQGPLRGGSQTNLARTIGKLSDVIFYGDKTRRVEFILALRTNDDIYWCREQLSELMNLGSSQQRLICGRIFTFQGDDLGMSIPHSLQDRWKIHTIGRMQLEQSFKVYLDACAFSPGSKVTVVSGSPAFANTVRQLVLNSSYTRMDFKETDFSPDVAHHSVRSVNLARGAQDPRRTSRVRLRNTPRIALSDIKVVHTKPLDGQTAHIYNA